MNVQELRKTRIGPFAAFDTLGTVGGAALFSYYWQVSLWKTVPAAFGAGIIAHELFKQETPMALAIRGGLEKPKK